MKTPNLSFLTTDTWILEKAYFAISKSTSNSGFLGVNPDALIHYLHQNKQDQKHLLFVQSKPIYLRLCGGHQLRKQFDIEIILLGSFLPPEHIPLVQSNGIVGYISPDEINSESLNKISTEILNCGYYSNKHISFDNWNSKPIQIKPLPMPNFTEREKQIIQEMCHGYIASEIALQICTTVSNVRYIIANVKKKLSAKSDKEIIAICLVNQWVTLERSKFNNQNIFIQSQ